MEEYVIRRFVDGKEVKELTDQQKRLLALNVIRAIGGKVTKEKTSA